MHSEKVITYLEMTGPAQLRWAKAVEGLALAPVEDPAGVSLSQLQEVHDRIAAAHRWSSLAWSTRHWVDWLSDPALRHWWIRVRDEVAGWGCLRRHPGRDVELDTFGLSPEYIGHGYGGYSLSLLTHAAWSLQWPENGVELDGRTRRVWLRTSNWDHPHALANYQARGFVQRFRPAVASFQVAPPGNDAAMSEPMEERAKNAVRDVHQAATRHQDDSLHQAAVEISRMAGELGHDPGSIEDWRSCPVCGAEPGALCISVPGHDMVDNVHPERTRE
ncbi:GNAT family N-acetyltransferase [Micromonospora sp. CV4]|nr:GNAT family N-acetyltransferase [Micromonospora sp. CV4]